MIRFIHKGGFKNTEKLIDRILDRMYYSKLAKYGEEGVIALAGATPQQTGRTASSWYYEITKEGSDAVITWKNSNVNKHVNIAVIIQTGHGTGTGGYVRGIDYINPALQPIFDKIADSAWKEVMDL